MRKTLLSIFVAAALTITPTVAAERSVEIVAGESTFNGEGVTGQMLTDVDAENVHIRVIDEFGSSGIFSGVLNLERFDPDGIGEAYNVDTLVRATFGRGQLKLYGTGGFGAVFSNLELVTQTTEITTVDSFNQSGQRTTETTELVEISTADQEIGLRGILAGGAQLFFTSDQRWGLGAEAVVWKPIDGGSVIDEDRGWRFYLIVPAVGAP